MRDSAEVVTLGHGSGGRLTHDLIEKVIIPALHDGQGAPAMEDSAIFTAPSTALSFTTDSYVVTPCFFPGGNIGDLAVNGTINDLAMSGAEPLALSMGLILEEGFLMEELRAIMKSMGEASRLAGAPLVCGDTKVAPRGKADKIFINTSGVGVRPGGREVHSGGARPGDVVIINGTVGDHGIAVMSVREGLRFDAPVKSDTAALHTLVRALFDGGVQIHAMRDPTRGGLATTMLEIAADSGAWIRLDEGAIPMSRAVAGACELLGLDPLTVANEGKMIAVVPEKDAAKALSIMQAHPLGREAAVIGRVTGTGKGRVTTTSLVGGERVMTMPHGEILPRIC
ncbi:MAG: hydrogenase expression/formation protein HypE [Nitrospinota bacterium]|nr:hydrogenase expression/formation protein HypE [Nitrospinota bacterium]